MPPAGPVRQVPLQHWTPSVQTLSVAKQAPHTPPTQDGVQHSLSLAQVAPGARHWSHDPAVQCPVQHSPSAVQVLPSATQQSTWTNTPGAGGTTVRHASPEQQAALAP